MASIGKTKGNIFERKIAALFQERFKHLFPSEIIAFKRNITSGATFGGSNIEKITQYLKEHQLDIGDILTPSNFKFTIECKHYKTPFNINNIFTENNKILNSWIEQAEKQSKLAGKYFLLIIKYNDVKEIVITNNILLESFFNTVNHIKYKNHYVLSFEYFLNNLSDEIFFENILS